MHREGGTDQESGVPQRDHVLGRFWAKQRISASWRCGFPSLCREAGGGGIASSEALVEALACPRKGLWIQW